MRILLSAAGLGIVLVACTGGDAGTGITCNHEGELSSVGRHCPPTYDGTEANLPMCPAADDVGFPVAQRTVWQCQDLFVLQFYGLSGLVCYYDTTSHALVGAESYTDTRCDDQPIGVEAGRTNWQCRENAPLFSRACASP